TVTVIPLRARPEEQTRVAAGLFKTGRLRREIKNRDLIDPAGFDIAVRRNAQRWMIPPCFLFKTHLAICNRQAKRDGTKGFGRGLQIVPLTRVTPGQHKPSVPGDITGAAARERVV